MSLSRKKVLQLHSIRPLSDTVWPINQTPSIFFGGDAPTHGFPVTIRNKIPLSRRTEPVKKRNGPKVFTACGTDGRTERLKERDRHRVAKSSEQKNANVWSKKCQPVNKGAQKSAKWPKSRQFLILLHFY